MTAPGERPLLIGHRFGNDLDRLDHGRSLGIDLIETDVHFYKGRLEIRHMKTVGPIGLLWDGLRLGNPFADRLQLEDLLAALTPDDQLMLDLKPVMDGRGNGERMAKAIITAVDQITPGQPVTVCSRKWGYLPHFAGRDKTRVVYSCGSAAERERLLKLPHRIDGVSIRHDLITPEAGPRLRERTDLVMTWTVNDLETVERTRDLGATAFISDRPEVIGPALTAR